MTTVRIAHAEPRPGKLGNTGPGRIELRHAELTRGG